jgi:mannitol-specific phosphotransferase system IIBC component
VIVALIYFQADYQSSFRIKTSLFFETIFIFIIITIIVHRHRNESSEEILERKSDNLKLIKKNAKQVIIAKLQKEKNDEKKRVDAQFMRI